MKKPEKVRLKIKKIDGSTNEPLEATHFILSESHDFTIAPSEATTIKNGFASEFLKDEHLLDVNNTYYLKESQPTLGYQPLQGYYQFKIDSEGTATLHYLTNNGTTLDKTSEITYTTYNGVKTICLTVENKREPAPLPKTGGSGRTTFFVIAGGLLIIGCGYFLFRKKEVEG